MTDSPNCLPLRPAHPLALVLIERLRERPGAPVLEVGSGSGRNTRVLREARLDVTSSRSYADLPVRGCFEAALSTHALLHGRPAEITRALADIADLLAPNAALFATFGSVRDARYGLGERLENNTFAPTSGDERDVPHSYFDASGLGRLIACRYEIESFAERSVDDIVGDWGHRQAPLSGAYHWFTIARRR